MPQEEISGKRREKKEKKEKGSSSVTALQTLYVPEETRTGGALNSPKWTPWKRKDGRDRNKTRGSLGTRTRMFIHLVELMLDWRRLCS